MEMIPFVIPGKILFEQPKVVFLNDIYTARTGKKREKKEHKKK